MNLKNISNEELTQRLEKLVRSERKITHLVLLHIIKIEERKIYAEMGFDGMYTYLTRGLGYSEASAYRRLQAARLLKQVPSVADKIESGALNLSQLTQVQKCLKEDAKIGVDTSIKRTEEILESLQHKNTFETQKTLAVEFNQPIQKTENLKPQADESVRIEVTLTAEQFQELEQAKSLLSHICPEGSWADIIGVLAKNYNQKKLGKNTEKTTHSVRATKPKSGQRKSGLMLMRQSLHIRGHEICKNTDPKNKEKTTQPVLATEPIYKSVPRKYISVHTKRELLTKANHCCEYVDPKTKKKCQSKSYLEIDHIHPVALGGEDDIKNLRILCRSHNNLAARQYGLFYNLKVTGKARAHGRQERES